MVLPLDLFWYFALYHLLILPVDAAAAYYVWKHPTWRSLLLSALAIVFVAVSISFLFPTGIYLALRFTCHGWFFHLPLLFIGSSWLLWRRRRAIAIVCLGGGLSVLGIVVDAFVIEPQWLRVTQFEIQTGKIDQPLRIGVMADVQTDHVGKFEAKSVNKMMGMRPDLILMAGDYIQTHDATQRERLHQQLNRVFCDHPLTAPRGIFVVGGNNDEGNWTTVFAGLENVRLFSGSDTVVQHDIQITGLSTRDSFNTQLQTEIDTKNRFHIMLGHAPDFALGDIHADLLVAGHTHGGQVQLPWIGPLMTLSAVPRSWAQGKTELANGATLIVSRGLGLERGLAPRVRFFCRPEIVIIDVVPAPPRTK